MYTVTGLLPGALVYIEVYAFVDYTGYGRRWSDEVRMPEVTNPKTPIAAGSVIMGTTTFSVGFEVDEGSHSGWLISYASFGI